MVLYDQVFPVERYVVLLFQAVFVFSILVSGDVVWTLGFQAGSMPNDGGARISRKVHSDKAKTKKQYLVEKQRKNI